MLIYINPRSSLGQLMHLYVNLRIIMLVFINLRLILCIYYTWSHPVVNPRVTFANVSVCDRFVGWLKHFIHNRSTANENMLRGYLIASIRKRHADCASLRTVLPTPCISQNRTGIVQFPLETDKMFEDRMARPWPRNVRQTFAVPIAAAF